MHTPSSSKKSFFPTFQVIPCKSKHIEMSESFHKTTKSKKLSWQYHSPQRWYQSVTGIVFFLVIFVFFSYTSSILSIVNNILRKGTALSSEEFHDRFHASRTSIQNLQLIMTLMTILLGMILATLLWSGLPDSLKCTLFNQHTALLLVFIVLGLSSWSENEIVRTSNVGTAITILNTSALAISSSLIFLYLLLLLNHHFHIV